MLNNDNSSQTEQQSREAPQACCPPTYGTGDCCSPASGSGRQMWKILIFVAIVAAAGVVLARSLVKKSNATVDEAQSTFPAIASLEGAETTPRANATTKAQASNGIETALWGPELDSLASLDEMATEVDAVFILIAGKNQQDAQTLTGEIEAATKKIRSRGNRISAFRLKEEATDYENMAEQFSVPTVLAMVKGLGYRAVSGQITEANLLEAFVTASRASAGCCPPGTDPSACGAVGCGPSGCSPSDSK